RTAPNYDLKEYFDDCLTYTDAEEAVELAARFTPVAYHLFALAGDRSSTAMINARVGPTVFDTTDMLEGVFLGNHERTQQFNPLIRMQTHALRYADGYC